MHKTLNNQHVTTEDIVSDVSKTKSCVFQNILGLNKNISKFVGHSFLKLSKENANKKFNKTLKSPYLCKIFYSLPNAFLY